MGPVDGLGLGGGVPPRVEQDAVVGLGQVEPKPAGLQADQEDLGVALPELLDGSLAVLGRSIEVRHRNPEALDDGGGGAEEPGELAEDEDLVALGHHVLHHLREQLELGRGDTGVRRVDQADVERRLAQQREGPEDLEPVAVHVVEETEDLAALAVQVGVVDLPVLGAEFDLEHLLGLLGQLSRHDLLGAPQHEGPDPVAQLDEALGVLALLDGCGVVLLEPLGRPEEARGADGEERPELEQVVLHRGAGDGHLERNREHAGSPARLGGGVLHELGLVQEQARPRH